MNSYRTWRELDDGGGVSVLDQLVEKRTRFKRRHKVLANELGLGPSTQRIRLQGVEEMVLDKPKNEYPPRGVEIAESQEIADLWNDYRQRCSPPKPSYGGKKGDSTWPEILTLECDKLKTIAPERSVIIRDSQTEEIVLIILRNFYSNEEILGWANEIIEKNLGV